MGQGGFSEEEISAYAKGYLARYQKQRSEDAHRAQVLLSRAKRAASRVGEEFKVARVWLFGSVAWGGVHSESDIDLLVEGLPKEQWDAAYACAETAADTRVDFIRAEEAAPGLVQRAHKEGVLLYEPK